jgi:hypothetical protein
MKARPARVGLPFDKLLRSADPSYEEQHHPDVKTNFCRGPFRFRLQLQHIDSSADNESHGGIARIMLQSKRNMSIKNFSIHIARDTHDIR